MELAQHKHSIRCLGAKMELQRQFLSLIVTQSLYVGTMMALFAYGKVLMESYATPFSRPTCPRNLL